MTSSNSGECTAGARRPSELNQRFLTPVEFEALVCYSQLLILLVIAVAYLYHYRPGPHAKWTFSVIACGLLLFFDALLLPPGGWLQLALKAVMVVGAPS